MNDPRPNPRSWIAPVALAVALLSLLANGLLLSRLRHPERLAAPAVGRALDRLGNSDASIKYQVRVPSGTPLHFDVPFDQTYRIRLNATFPINTTVAVPLKGPLGTYTVRLPIRTSIPVKTDMPLRLQDTFRVRTQTQTEYVIPLEIRIRDLPLDELRKSLEP
ncbi:MAG: hypothetical protein ICV87_05955 [Gemmatimonadetes bacterium]|nr:hypothetical protein [Gemmatimonadota bacterium]